MRLIGRHLRFTDGIDPERNAEVHARARALLRRAPDGVSDVVPSYGSIYLEVDADRMSDHEVDRWIETSAQEASATQDGRSVELPVRYDGPDLDDLARDVALTPAEVAELHARPNYRVYALGFLPGFPFLGTVDARLRRPRRPHPRMRVPAHAVGVAGAQTGVYALPSPGGWNLIGTALEALYDPHRERPFLLEPGDRVRFVASEGVDPPEPQPLDLLPADPVRPVFAVRSAGLADLIVDRGRFRVGRYGLARSGPLDAPAAALANRLVANPAHAALLEVNLVGPELEVLDDIVVAFTGAGVRPERNGEAIDRYTSVLLAKGDVLRFVPSRHGARGYLALAGGIDSDRFLDSASVDLRARIGRPLAVGDVIGTSASGEARPGFSFRPYRGFGTVGRAQPVAPLPIRIAPGPHPDPDALAALTSGSFVVRSGDRTGVQFEGPEVPGRELLSEATPLGGIQVTPAGRPLVLLHDRGTIGGYAVPAVVVPADLPRIAQLRSGQSVRFTLVPRAPSGRQGRGR